MIDVSQLVRSIQSNIGLPSRCYLAISADKSVILEEPLDVSFYHFWVPSVNVKEVVDTLLAGVYKLGSDARVAASQLNLMLEFERLFRWLVAYLSPAYFVAPFVLPAILL